MRHNLSHTYAIIDLINKEIGMQISNNTFNSIAGYSKICKLWTMQIIMKMGGHKNVYSEFCCEDDELSNDFGIVTTDKDNNYSRQIAMENMRTELVKIEKNITKLPTKTILAKNIQWIAENVELNDLEQRLILFFVLERQDNHLRTASTSLGGINSTRLFNMLGRIMEVNPAQIRKSLHPDSRLCKSGLVYLDSQTIKSFPEKISLSSGLSDRVLVKHKNPFNLFEKNFKVSGKPLLSADNFTHLQLEIEHLDCYLKQSLSKNKTGINILIYGTPGSGKTEFVKMLAKHSRLNLYEIACGHLDGAPMQSGGRLQSYTLTQNVLEKTPRPLIMFDEIEDVFNLSDVSNGCESEGKSNASGQKAWLNALLESNPVPTFWVTNNISVIDPAHLRRYDYHIEMKVPPRNVRLKIIDEYTAELPVTSSWRNALAEHDKINPAVIAKAKKFATTILKQNPSFSAEKLMTHVISNSLQAMGLGEVKNTVSIEMLNYQLDVVNASCDLEELTDGLRQHSEARLCLYGPSGTGKTAFGHHLAKLLDKPLLVKRSSDIVSPYLGITESNIAKMFREAQSSNSVLLLDEADSFLRDRSCARHSWEVTAVNEMLTQMETFNGIFIASTNLMNQLDAASLRRFDMKIEFDYLRSEQSYRLMIDLADKLSISLQEHELDELRQLTNLTPGDFANVARQSKLTKLSNGNELLRRLSLESKSKIANHLGKMGFI
jgi:transitional endoplasmic reticulum ATPase